MSDINIVTGAPGMVHLYYYSIAIGALVIAYLCVHNIHAVFGPLKNDLKTEKIINSTVREYIIVVIILLLFF